MKACVVLTTFPADANVTDLAARLVESRLAACVNVFRGVGSIYRWQERTQIDAETLVLIKTTEARLEALREALFAQHPYDVPEFVVLPAEAYGAYGEWLAQSVSYGQ